MTIVIMVKRQDESQQTIAAGKFKATCLQLMDEVNEFGHELVITKHGKPVAKLVPIEEQPEPKSYYGYMKGTIEILGDIVSPIDVEWTYDQDNV